MKLKFLLDEQISPRVADRAKRYGLNIHAVAQSELAGSDDPTVFRAAIEQGRIVVTYNIRDFAALYGDLLKEGVNIPGLVFVDGEAIPTSDIQGLAKALMKLAEKIDKGEADPSGGIFLAREGQEYPQSRGNGRGAWEIAADLPARQVGKIVREVMPLLKDSDENVRWHVTEFLGDMGPKLSAEQAAEAAIKIVPLLKIAHCTGRAWAAIALVELGRKELVPKRTIQDIKRVTKWSKKYAKRVDAALKKLGVPVDSERQLVAGRETLETHEQMGTIRV